MQPSLFIGQVVSVVCESAEGCWDPAPVGGVSDDLSKGVAPPPSSAVLAPPTTGFQAFTKTLGGIVSTVLAPRTMTSHIERADGINALQQPQRVPSLLSKPADRSCWGAESSVGAAKPV